jgi:hypothetical protein
MLRVIALNQEINALIGIEVSKGFCRGNVAMTGKSPYTEDVIVYPAPAYIPHKYPHKSKTKKPPKGGLLH